MSNKQPIVDEAAAVLPESADTDAMDTADTSAAVSVPAKAIDATQGFALSQRVFVLLALCVVIFSVYDTYSKQPESVPPALQQSFDALDMRIVAGPSALAETITLLEGRRIFGPPPLIDEPVPGPTPVGGWRAEVREHWELKGTSGIPGGADPAAREAIVFDNRAQRLQFLRAGVTKQIAQQDVQVVRVDADRVELRSGDEIFVLD